MASLAAAGIAAAGGAGAQQTEAPPAPDSVTPEDIAVLDRIEGYDYTEAERKLMAPSLTETRASLKKLRAALISAEVEPAIHFDPRLPGTPVPKGKPAFRLSSGPGPSYDGHPESLAFAPAVELSRLIKSREITSTALTRMYLDRLKRFGPRLNCVVTLMEEQALAQAARADREMAAGKYRGPLHGIPWGAKDLLATRGTRTTFGAKPYENQVLDFDATVVKRLDEAGAVLLAKLSMGELAMGDVWFGGITRNPWKPSTGSSGSSAGPGAATAAGLVGFAIGSETLGSIVSPSCVNGVTGLRPTYGRVSRHGAMALSWTMDKLGPMARGVEDCAMVLNAIYDPDGLDPTVADVPFRWNPDAPLSGLRVGIDTTSFEAFKKNPHAAALQSLYDDALNTLKKLGIPLKPVTLPPMTDLFRPLAWLIIGVESSSAFMELTASGQLDLLAQQGPNNWPNSFRKNSAVPAADYLRAMRARTLLQERMAEALKDVDLYVTIPRAGPSLVYTNLTGHPTVVTRCGLYDGLPQMIEFTGQLYREDAILRVARAFEQATAHHKQWPDTDKLPEVPPPVG